MTGQTGDGSLPAAIRRYLGRVLPSPPEPVRLLRVEQTGEMILKPGASPRPFTATEEFALDRVAFAWSARFAMLGPLTLRVTDSYDGRDGLLAVRLFGLPLARKRGEALAKGQTLRYLAEIPWMPHTILWNPQLDWRELDQRSVEVATRVAGEPVALQLLFDETGEIVRTVARRPRVEAGNAMTTWIGIYRDYRELAGARIPTRAEVRYELPEGPFTYWRGVIRSLELCE